MKLPEKILISLLILFLLLVTTALVVAAASEVPDTWISIQSGYCGRYSCYVDGVWAKGGDVFHPTPVRVPVTYWVFRDAYPGRLCKFYNPLHGRYRSAVCKF